MEITKEMEAMAKLLNSGASITFSCCQIVFGDNAILGDILKKDTAHASTTQDPQGVEVAVSKSVSCYESYKSWPNEAKKIRNILL